MEIIGSVGRYNQSTLALLETAPFIGRCFDGRSMVGQVVFVTLISGGAVQ
tara:strand:+ start:1371 stop:1520 length:150 start_codon:yes stop_codon:yes gene_type:complete